MALLTTSSAGRNERVFTIALWVVIGFAAVELFAAFIHFGMKYRDEHAVVQVKPPPPSTKPTEPAISQTTPNVTEPQSSPPPSAADRLLQEANVFRERGDTANALARLQEAAQRDPHNAQVLAKTAEIYESIQLFDRSNETWRKVQELGPSAGPLYELAERKLSVGVPATTPVAGPNTDTAGKPIDSEGIPEGSSFGITDISAEEIADPDTETNLRLKIAIKKRPGTEIDHSKLRIMVLFYDLLDNEKVVATDADVSYEWMSTKHDWNESNPETLIVTYLRSKTHAFTSDAALSAAAAAVTPGKTSPRAKKRTDEQGSGSSAADAGRRKYLGYVIRILYNDKLQTVRADPPRLVTDAPTTSP